MLGGLLDLRDLTVADVMIHRTEVITADVGEPVEKVVERVLGELVTRIPLWRGSPENIVGILHVKDLLRAIQAAGGDLGKVDIMAIARPPWFVPDIRPLSEQLKAFRRRRTPLALVVDEYGEFMGIVTLEDILEEIVGDITDEHDVEVAGVRPQPDGSVNVDGAVPIRDLNRAMDWNLPDDEATTIAGLVIHEARSIPNRARASPFTAFVSRCCGGIATVSKRCGSPRWRRKCRRKPPDRKIIWVRPSGEAFLGRGRVDREGVDAGLQFARERGIYHAVALEPALPSERVRHDIDPNEFRRPADGRHGPRAGGDSSTTSRLCGTKASVSFLCDEIASAHATSISRVCGIASIAAHWCGPEHVRRVLSSLRDVTNRSHNR